MIKTPHSFSGLLSTSEAAELLGITRQGVMHLIGKGVLRAEKVGRFMVIRSVEVEQAKSRDRKRGPKSSQATVTPKPQKG